MVRKGGVNMQHVLLRRHAAACLWSVAMSATSLVAAADLRFDPALAKAPPAVAQASIELLSRPVAAGNAVLRVRFVDKRAKSPVVVQGGGGPTLLRDDGMSPDEKAGDGLYAAIVNVNAEAVTRERQRRLSLAPKVRETPVFRMRELLGWEPFRPTDNVRLVPGVPSLIDRFRGIALTVDASRELLVRDTSVVNEPGRTYDACTGAGTPMGAWTFGKLMTEIANTPATGIDAADLVEHWLDEWMTDQAINGWTVPNRSVGVTRVLDAWPRLPGGKLDLAQAPFRLLAIVNRLDLRSNAFYGSGDAGEGRLVFGLLNCSPAPQFPEVQQFTVIFEYGIPRTGCLEVRDWAQQWHALGSLAIGSAAYNAALQAITDQFTLRNLNPSRLPNRSAINQVRTNEFALATMPADTFWQLREGKLIKTGWLDHGTVAQTPDRTFRLTTTLRDFVNDNTPAILAGTHQVPLEYPAAGHPFRAGFIEPGAGFAWDAAGIADLEARHRFSLATCNGCHTAETATAFLHIEPRASGSASQLSDFLTGANMPKTDPVSHVPRTFHDLLDRAQKLDLTANMSCFKTFDFPLEEIFFEPLPPAFAH
jgi:hypothetical protein